MSVMYEMAVGSALSWREYFSFLLSCRLSAVLEIGYPALPGLDVQGAVPGAGKLFDDHWAHSAFHGTDIFGCAFQGGVVSLGRCCGLHSISPSAQGRKNSCFPDYYNQEMFRNDYVWGMILSPCLVGR